MGFKGVFIDGIDRVLGTRSAHRLYRHPELENLGMILRDYRFSDEISFRFSDGPSPLTAEHYIQRLRAIPEREPVVGIAMDYETFGEHQKKEKGIFSFMESLFRLLARDKQFRMRTPSEVVENTAPADALTVPGFISWADEERDLSAWLGNEMQRDAFDSLLKTEADLKALNDPALLKEWRTLQTSDHFYYMSTKKGNDGGVHSYFSPYPSPYEAFINYMNVLTDFGLRVKISKSAAAVAKKSRVQAPEELAVPV
jgi:alpha-amylase